MSVDQAVGVASGATTTLGLFKSARDQIVEVLTEARKEAHVLGPLQAELEDDFEKASKAVEASRLKLVVVGGEGCGKSTLINALTGSDVTPRSKMYPGTVAPVFLEWGPKADPEYSVVVGGETQEKRCKNPVEFGEYLLQQHNPNNHKNVQLGYARWNHPILQQGLMLVDMPGVEGVSPAIRQQAEQFIKMYANAVIGIVRDRGWAPLVRIAHTFSHQDLAMQALVCNWDLGVWLDPYDKVQENPEAERERFVAEIPGVALKMLDEEGGGIVVSEDRVYVLHLPTCWDRVTRQTTATTLDSAAHERERLRFEKAFWDYVRANGVKEVILDASRRAEQALLELDVLLTTRQRALESVLGGDDKTAAKLADDFAQGRSRAERTWTEAYNDEVIEGVAQQHWGTFAEAVEGARNWIVDKIREIEVQVRAYEGKMRKPEAQAIWKQLTDYIATEQGPLAESQEKLLDEVNDYYCQFANASLDELYKAVPLIRETVPKEFKLSRKGLQDFVLKGLETSTMESVLKGGGVLAGAAAGAAVGSVFPGYGTLIGGIIGAIGGFGIVDSLRDGERPGVLKGLAEASQQVMAIDTSDSGEVRGSWAASVREVADTVNAYVTERISRLEAMIADPGANTEELESNRTQVEEARGAVKDLQGRLTMIAGFTQA